MSQLLLLASAHSYRSDLFTQAAARVGVEVVRGEDVPPPMVGRVNVPLPLDYQDLPRAARQIGAYARKHPVRAILGLDDSGTLLAASACQALGLPYNAPEAALAARNKHLMRQRFAEAGVPSPAFAHHLLTEDPARIASETQYPCVLKPTTLSGSRGVMRADSPAEFRACHARLRAILEAERCDEFLVEDFIPGFEVALEGLLHEGHLHILALFDKPDPLDGPFFEETLYVTPSRLPAETQQAIARVAGQAAAALGLHHGPIHAELRVDGRGPWMVEIAARSIGGMCSKTLRFGTGLSLEELIVRQAVGLIDEGALAPMPSAGGVMMIPIPEAGLLEKIEGVEEAERVPGIEGVEIGARLYYPLVPLPEGDSYLGFIFARGETPNQVEAALRAAHSKLKFTIRPQIPLLAVEHSFLPPLSPQE